MVVKLTSIPLPLLVLTICSIQTWRRREIEPKIANPKTAESELEVRYLQMEKRMEVMEASLAAERKINKELEADLQTAVNEGIKYRDHLARMVEIREKDERAQKNIKSKQDHDDKVQNATLAASLKEAEKSVQFERAEALRMESEIQSLQALASSSQEENSSLHAQVSFASFSFYIIRCGKSNVPCAITYSTLSFRSWRRCTAG